MGFFIRDRHNHSTKLHAQQFTEQTSSSLFTVYCDQRLSRADFVQLNKSKGGLLSFNNFLSTSMHGQVFLNFVREIMESSNLVSILFVMQIDLSIESTSLAYVHNVSYFEGEEEILFSMHSTFRIGPMQ
ncbi:unnamed protein product [Rotaria sp. Silwood1]|nr:unnamed protein product [Rotaria sp. Silwood1]